MCARMSVHIWRRAHLHTRACTSAADAGSHLAPIHTHVSCIPGAHLCAHLAAPRMSPPACHRARGSLPAEAEESSHFVIGAVLYRTLGLILPPPR